MHDAYQHRKLMRVVFELQNGLFTLESAG